MQHNHVIWKNPDSSVKKCWESYTPPRPGEYHQTDQHHWNL